MLLNNEKKHRTHPSGYTDDAGYADISENGRPGMMRHGEAMPGGIMAADFTELIKRERIGHG